MSLNGQKDGSSEKYLCTVLLLPFFLIGLVMVGMIYLAIPILIVVGLVAIIGGIMEA